MRFLKLVLALLAAAALTFTAPGATATSGAHDGPGKGKPDALTRTVAGRVVAVSASSITIAKPVPCRPHGGLCTVPNTRAVNRIVALTPATQIVVSGNPGAASDIKVGHWASVKVRALRVLVRCAAATCVPPLRLVATKVVARPAPFVR